MSSSSESDLYARDLEFAKRLQEREYNEAITIHGTIRPGGRGFERGGRSGRGGRGGGEANDEYSSGRYSTNPSRGRQEHRSRHEEHGSGRYWVHGRGDGSRISRIHEFRPQTNVKPRSFIDMIFGSSEDSIAGIHCCINEFCY